MLVIVKRLPTSAPDDIWRLRLKRELNVWYYNARVVPTRDAEIEIGFERIDTVCLHRGSYKRLLSRFHPG